MRTGSSERTDKRINASTNIVPSTVSSEDIHAFSSLTYGARPFSKVQSSRSFGERMICTFWAHAGVPCEMVSNCSVERLFGRGAARLAGSDVDHHDIVAALNVEVT